ncbi:MAG: ABC transporter permease [bacterium]
MNRFKRISLRFIAKRLASGLPVLLAVIVTSFIILRLTPGGPFDREKPLPPEIQKTLRAHYHLDRPVFPVYVAASTPAEQQDLDAFEARYGVLTLGGLRIVAAPSGWPETQMLDYLVQLSKGDLGASMKFQQESVNSIIARSLPVSLLLGLWAFVLAYVAGISLGVIAAAKRGKTADTVSMVAATLGISTPNFVLAALLVLVFALRLKWFPAGLWESGWHVVLPVVTLAAAPTAYIARLTRSGVLEVLGEDFIRTARSKGAKPMRVLFRHALPNALGPLITVAGPLLATLVTGSFVVEHVFSIPGMGRYFITAVTDRDYPLVMGITLVYCTLVVVANVAVDVLYSVADPRIEP